MQIGNMSAIGLEISFAVGIGTIGGYYLDRYFDMNPLFTILGLLAGCGAAVKALIRVVKDFNRAAEEEEGEEPGQNSDQRNNQ